VFTAQHRAVTTGAPRWQCAGGAEFRSDIIARSNADSTAPLRAECQSFLRNYLTMFGDSGSFHDPQSSTANCDH
jgi:hypothetical protein